MTLTRARQVKAEHRANAVGPADLRSPARSSRAACARRRSTGGRRRAGRSAAAFRRGSRTPWRGPSRPRRSGSGRGRQTDPPSQGCSGTRSRRPPGNLRRAARRCRRSADGPARAAPADPEPGAATGRLLVPELQDTVAVTWFTAVGSPSVILAGPTGSSSPAKCDSAGRSSGQTTWSRAVRSRILAAVGGAPDPAEHRAGVAYGPRTRRMPDPLPALGRRRSPRHLKGIC